MTETLFERYKEALRAGHVAVLRRRLDDAAAAYRQAIAVAPDRAVPRAALGNVLLRLGDPEAALVTLEEALAFAPDDEPTLLGRAQALVVLRRTDKAAATYDRLASLRESGGRLAEAAEASRRALAIEPTEPRRTRHAALVAALREAEGPAVASTQDVEDGAATELADVEGAPDGAIPPEPEPELVPPPDPEALVVTMEEAAAAGDVATAATAALAAGQAFRDRGQHAAAFDACLEGIRARPADADLHLLLAELAAGRGFVGHAADTYRRLERLVELDAAPELVEAVRAARDGHLAGDERSSAD